jgi:hypothetical protein
VSSRAGVATDVSRCAGLCADGWHRPAKEAQRTHEAWLGLRLIERRETEHLLQEAAESILKRPSLLSWESRWLLLACNSFSRVGLTLQAMQVCVSCELFSQVESVAILPCQNEMTRIPYTGRRFNGTQCTRGLPTSRYAAVWCFRCPSTVSPKRAEYGKQLLRSMSAHVRPSALVEALQHPDPYMAALLCCLCRWARTQGRIVSSSVEHVKGGMTNPTAERCNVEATFAFVDSEVRRQHHLDP